jgi:hypothetical protein
MKDGQMKKRKKRCHRTFKHNKWEEQPNIIANLIVLSVLLRYTDSDYHFGTFKLFLRPFHCHTVNPMDISIPDIDVVTS